MAKNMKQLMIEEGFTEDEFELAQFVLRNLKYEYDSKVDKLAVVKNKIEEVCKNEIKKHKAD